MDAAERKPGRMARTWPNTSSSTQQTSPQFSTRADAIISRAPVNGKGPAPRYSTHMAPDPIDDPRATLGTDDVSIGRAVAEQLNVLGPGPLAI
eukprot:6297318-Pyramimonas_sp.AAC.1